MSMDLARLVSPTSIAVFGASPDERRFGGRPLRNLTNHGFPGRIIPINPKYTEVRGIPCFGSLEESGQRPDLALVAVPGDRVMSVLADCARAGVGMVVVFSSGFAESGDAGSRAQAEIAEFTQRADMRVMGPNCLGFLNTRDRVTAVATGALEQPDLPVGSISLVSQSGAMGFVGAFNRAYDAGVSYRYVAATGNEADLTAMDFLDLYLEDPSTTVVTALLESIRQPDRFLEFAHRSATIGKPVVILKTGRSDAAVRAAAAHTASLAGSDAVNDAVFRRYGIVRADDIDELWQVPQLLEWSKNSVGRRIGVISTSGGFNGILADQLTANGLETPSLSDRTVAALGRLLPPFAYLGNPLDLTGQFAGGPDEGRIFADVLTLLDRDPHVDVIALVQVIVRRDYEDVASTILDAVRALRKPVVIVAPGGAITDDGLASLLRTGIPVFRTATSAARALRLANAFTVHRESPEPMPARRSKVVSQSGRLDILSYRDTVDLLEGAGIPMVEQAYVSTPDEATAFAQRVGGPVALKAVGRGLAHKTEAEAVRLNLVGSQVEAEFRKLEDLGSHLGAGFEGVVAQRMVAGTEVIVGLKHDKQFGPILLVGAGGILAEFLRDVRLTPLPVSSRDIEALLDELQVGAVLRGVRGREPMDVAALRALIESVARLGLKTQATLEALDLNPVVVLPEGKGVAVVDALAVARGPR